MNLKARPIKERVYGLALVHDRCIDASCMMIDDQQRKIIQSNTVSRNKKRCSSVSSISSPTRRGIHQFVPAPDTVLPLHFAFYSYLSIKGQETAGVGYCCFCLYASDGVDEKKGGSRRLSWVISMRCVRRCMSLLTCLHRKL